jgi:hypothetical protein
MLAHDRGGCWRTGAVADGARVISDFRVMSDPRELFGPGGVHADGMADGDGDRRHRGHGAERRIIAAVTTARGSRGHRTGLRCTIFHRFRAAAVFYPVFYPKRRRSGVEMVYLLVKGTNWSSRPERYSSFPS